jgi:phosphate:Na+ symporter
MLQFHDGDSVEQGMSGTHIFIGLLGAAALLVWALRMVRTGIMRAYGGNLRKKLGGSMASRLSAFAAGLGVTVLLQSSTATSLMASSFASRGLVATTPALAIMLGADVGTSLVAQVFSTRLDWLSPMLILVGVIMFMGIQASRPRDIGRALVGLGLVLLALSLVAAAAAPMRESKILVSALGALSDEPLLAIVVAALLTLLSTSSLAVVLLIISFAANDVIQPSLAFVMVLGANLGSAGTPLLATLRSTPEARRVPFGNLIFRLVGVALAVPALPYVEPLLPLLEPEAWRQVANFHTAFNIALAVLFLPLVGLVGWFCVWAMPDRPEAREAAGRPRYLDPGAIDSPAVALANAARETLRMGDMVEAMLRKTIEVFRADDRRQLREVEQMDDGVDMLHEAIKLYLTDVSRETLDPDENRRAIDIITFTTNLEHIGDIIDKNLMELANKKIRNKLRFSDEGFQEISAMHARLMENLKLALNVFVTPDVRLARRLLGEKIGFRELERTASESHLGRLKSGKLESIETSSLHLDVLRDLKRINSHLTSVAYPILDAAGELSQSRLKAAGPPSGSINQD